MDTSITFTEDDYPGRGLTSGEIPRLVTPIIANLPVNRVLVDGGCSCALITASALDRLQVSRRLIGPVIRKITGIIPGTIGTPLGQITLPVTFA